MRRSFIIALLVFLWFSIVLYVVRSNQFESHVRQIKGIYEKITKRLAQSISGNYFQWNRMYYSILENRSHEVEKLFEELRQDYPMIESCEIVKVQGGNELYRITSSSGKILLYMSVCDEDGLNCLSDTVVLLTLDAQDLLEELGIKQIKIAEKGKDFVFGLKYTRNTPLMDHPSLASAILSAFAVFLMSLLIESKRKMKIFIKETRLRRVQQSLLEVMEKYLQGTKIEQMYQFLLQKAIESIPNAQGGTVLVRRNDRYTYVAAIGYDLDGLSKVSYSEEEVRRWTKGKSCSINRPEYIASTDSRMDEERLKIMEKSGRLYEIKCNINFAVEVEGRLVILFNLDNFEDENAFDEETLELAKLFASYLGILFTKAKLEEKIEEQQRMMEYLTNHDPLTGLANRRAFEEYGEKMLSLASRQGKKVVVMFLDLSKFKQVNDVLGHEVGDEVLRVVGGRLEKSVRHGDLVARFGGDEFVLLVYDCDEECVKSLIDRLLSVIEEPIDLGYGEQIRISANVGVAFYPGDGESLDQLVRAADMAMYSAKRKGFQIAFFRANNI